MSICVENLHFELDKKPLLENISFKVNQSEFVGILGPNGSGKSTLMKTMLGILKPTRAKIEFFDKNINAYSIKELSKLIGFIPQKSELCMPLLVKDVLLMGLYPNLSHAYARYSKQDYKELEELAEQVNISHFLKRNILSLSGGEFQRVLLARALIKKPQILCLDEPTSALDMNYAIELLNLCENLKKERQLSIVAILHDLNLASLFCEKIIFLKNGTIAYQGTCEELFTKDILQDVYGIECQILHSNHKTYILPKK